MAKNSLGEKIKNAIKRMGLTQKEFEKKVGISNNLISRWNNGTRNPSINKLKKIAEATNMPLDYFLDNGQKVSKSAETENININLLMKFIEEKDEKVQEKIKRLETEILLLKKDNECFRENLKTLEKNYKL